MKSSKGNKGFTLIEVMIVVAILGLIAAIAIPNLVKAKKKAGFTGLHNVTIEWKEGIKKDEIDKTEVIRSVQSIEEDTDKITILFEDGSKKVILLKDVFSYKIEDIKRRKR